MKHNRKRWTKNESTEGDKFREIKKWQIALRRYVIDQKGSLSYAPYFGLDNVRLRNWIELFFNPEMQWDNFGKVWKFEHVVPVTYFNLEDPAHLKLCWNFVNIRPLAIGMTSSDLLHAKIYFQELWDKTHYHVCYKMIEVINSYTSKQDIFIPKATSFLQNDVPYIFAHVELSEYDFSRLNEGVEFKEILLEKEILQKFGA